MIPLLIIAAVIILLLIIAWSIYNKLVRAKNTVEEGFSGIDIQLKKRFELIPILIETLKGYNVHEATILENISANRAASGLKEIAIQDQSTTQQLKTFRVQVEAYPDLKANSQFIQFMSELSTIENELSMARRYFNGTVRDLNNKIEIFPNVLLAGVLGFKKSEFYEIKESAERESPVIDLKN